jgi:hypothetical protein
MAPGENSPHVDYSYEQKNLFLPPLLNILSILPNEMVEVILQYWLLYSHCWQTAGVGLTKLSDYAAVSDNGKRVEIGAGRDVHVYSRYSLDVSVPFCVRIPHPGMNSFKLAIGLGKYNKLEMEFGVFTKSPGGLNEAPIFQFDGLDSVTHCRRATWYYLSHLHELELSRHLDYPRYTQTLDITLKQFGRSMWVAFNNRTFYKLFQNIDNFHELTPFVSVDVESPQPVVLQII